MGVLYVVWVFFVGACFILGPLVLLLLILLVRGTPPEDPTDGGERDGIPLSVIRTVADHRRRDDPVRMYLVERYPELDEKAA